MSPNEPDGEDLDLEVLRLGTDRLDAVLESPYLTEREAAGALDAMWDAGTAAMPQVLIWRVYVPAYDKHPETWAPSYIGPFLNRQEAEEWARVNLPTGDDVSVEMQPMETPAEWAERTKRWKRQREEREREREARRRLHDEE